MADLSKKSWGTGVRMHFCCVCKIRKFAWILGVTAKPECIWSVACQWVLSTCILSFRYFHACWYPDDIHVFNTTQVIEQLWLVCMFYVEDKKHIDIQVNDFDSTSSSELLFVSLLIALLGVHGVYYQHYVCVSHFCLSFFHLCWLGSDGDIRPPLREGFQFDMGP